MRRSLIYPVTICLFAFCLSAALGYLSPDSTVTADDAAAGSATSTISAPAEKISLANAALIAAPQASADETLAGIDATDEGFVELIQGDTLEGWTTASGKPVTQGWEVKDGTLAWTESKGSLFTEKEYSDFILDFEWKISPAGNSGIKYRLTRYGKGINGPEYQILDDDKHPDGKAGPKRQSAALYDILECNDQKELKPVGEYNHSRIIVKGTRAQHWLNGRIVLEYDAARPEFQQALAQSKFKGIKDYCRKPAGRIMLQDHNDPVWFRNIRIKELKSE